MRELVLQPDTLTPFKQVDNSANREHAGTGLGLSLSRRLVELHGGSLSVSSNGLNLHNLNAD